MKDVERFKLRFGPYATPAFAYGAMVKDLERGRVRIVGLSAAKIPWPMAAERGCQKRPILYRGLVRAVRLEAKQAVAHHFGVSLWQVRRWRRALGVPAVNAGTSEVFSRWNLEPAHVAGLRNAHKKSRDPKRDRARRAKIAAAKLGKSRSSYKPPFRGNKHGEETKLRMSAAHKARGTIPPGKVAWTAAELYAVRTMLPEAAAAATGRSVNAVNVRRSRLKLPRLPRRNKPKRNQRSPG